MSYVIEEGIPVPEFPSAGKRSNGSKRGSVSPWLVVLDSLMPGQSSLTTEYKDWRSADGFRMRRQEKKFAIRKIPGQGWRVWRVE